MSLGIEIVLANLRLSRVYWRKQRPNLVFIFNSRKERIQSIVWTTLVWFGMVNLNISASSKVKLWTVSLKDNKSYLLFWITNKCCRHEVEHSLQRGKRRISKTEDAAPCQSNSVQKYHRYSKIRIPH